ncbi:pyridoxamine 5'-phosphate oxidase [Emericellopsis atlantica]|uniref:pyridoxal 5'-phosphate synthase n=1 Tax=Emericellopsis atlantica TaxID=2614577 RepID=A0A9P7ZJB1_9HYPO|nr:pyridoxamine 5'-phosphate oxidase [Emericellopsis atlantica]KAG9253163.1 pyridoxamine 5'-phosphate oxidase [Emericellopsis atlantica]
MALHSESSKLIFSPSGSGQNQQAPQFTRATLSVADLDPSSPIPQFHTWFTQAQASNAIPHAEACALSTAELPSGRVSSRMVYLKELDAAGGFVVYSNWATSRKSKDVATNPHVSLLFWWETLQQQVRVEGTASRLPREESQKYYDTRVRGSRIGAWASRQSEVLQPQDEQDDGRKQLEGWVREYEDKFEGQEAIPVPEFWGGLRVVPERVEFWQGRESRLHDRFEYVKDGDKWTLQRLSP